MPPMTSALSVLIGDLGTPEILIILVIAGAMFLGLVVIVLIAVLAGRGRRQE